MRWAIAFLAAAQLGAAVRITKIAFDQAADYQQEALGEGAPSRSAATGNVSEALLAERSASDNASSPEHAPLAKRSAPVEAAGSPEHAPLAKRLAAPVKAASSPQQRGAVGAGEDAPEHEVHAQPQMSSNAGIPQGPTGQVKPEMEDLRTPTRWWVAMLADIGKVLMAIGGGTGTGIRNDSLPSMLGEQESLAQYQNDVCAGLVVVAYFVVLGLGVSYLRWQAEVRSSVTYFASGGVGAMEGHDAVGFLTAFNQAPRQVLLHVTGRSPPEDVVGGQGPDAGDDGCRVAFNFALDLSQWIVHEEWSIPECVAEGGEAAAVVRPLLGGIEAAELERLQGFMESDRNDLAVIVLRKRVTWHGWEDVATNIRQRIKQCGFRGSLSVRYEGLETIRVKKSRAWARFMHHPSLLVLCMLSAVAWPVYSAYMYWRCTEFPVDANFRVNIQAEDYWSLISDQLSASGFNVTASSTGGSTD